MFFQGLEAKTLSFPVPSACFVEKQKTKKNLSLVFVVVI